MVHSLTNMYGSIVVADFLKGDENDPDYCVDFKLYMFGLKLHDFIHPGLSRNCPLLIEDLNGRT